MAYTPKPLINSKAFIMIIAIIAGFTIILFVAGSYSTKQCISIGSCSACWNTITRNTQSEACPTNQTCQLEPYISQQNAITDALLCACASARNTGDYPNSAINERIVEVYKILYGTTASVNDICESGTLVKISY